MYGETFGDARGGVYRTVQAECGPDISFRPYAGDRHTRV